MTPRWKTDKTIEELKYIEYNIEITANSFCEIYFDLIISEKFDNICKANQN